MITLPKSRGRRISLILLSVGFIFAGAYHFVNPEFYLPMMPDYLPAHEALILFSGVFEILGGIGILLNTTRKFSGWGIIAMLLVFQMAHVWMVQHPEAFEPIPVWALYVRILLQFVFIWWIYKVTVSPQQAS